MRESNTRNVKPFRDPTKSFSVGQSSCALRIPSMGQPPRMGMGGRMKKRRNDKELEERYSRRGRIKEEKKERKGR